MGQWTRNINGMVDLEEFDGVQAFQVWRKSHRGMPNHSIMLRVWDRTADRSGHEVSCQFVSNEAAVDKWKRELRL